MQQNQPQHQNGMPPTKKRRLNDDTSDMKSSPHRPPIQPKLELSFLMGLSPKNDLEDSVRKWAFDALAKGKSVEIEASLGCLIKSVSKEGTDLQEDKRVGEVYNFGSVAVVDRARLDGRFVPGIKPEAFQRLNKLLNQWTSNANTKNESRNKNLHDVAMPCVRYERIFEIDKIYDGGIRVTLEVKEPNKVKACIQKEKVSDLNLVCPHSIYDIRFSAKMEKEVFIPKNQIVKKLRTKDRISYIFDMFSVDLSTIHCYDQSARDPEFIEKLRRILKSHSEKSGTEKLPKTNDCEISYEVEIEICQKEELFNRRQSFQKWQIKNSPDIKPSPDEFNLVIRHLFQHIQHLDQLASVVYTPPQCVV